MKIIVAVMVSLVVILIAFIAECNADSFDLEWDYNTTVDGFRIYSGPMTEQSDGSWYPQLGDEPILSNIAPESRSATVVENGWAGQSKKFCFVARAFKGDQESADSNYVCAVIDNRPLSAPADPTGEYDRDLSMITITWTQTDADRVSYWRVFYRIADGDFADFVVVANTGQTAMTVTEAFDAVAEGEAADVEFSIVAFKDPQVYSPDSEVLTISVDRTTQTPLPPVENLRFKIEIPVE